jgi:TolB-like protein
VLTFANLTPDTASDYLSEGLADAIYTRLRQTGRFVLTSRTMVRRLPGVGTLTPAALGRALDAAYLVNGSVHAAAGRLRVEVECLRAADGRSVWADEFDRSQVDLLAIEEEIAIAVASQVAGRLDPSARRVLSARPTTSGAAYDLFYRANYALGQRSEASVMRARDAYAAARRIDPGFTAALAREAYADALCLDWNWRCGAPPESLLQQGRNLAEHAVREAPRLSDSWMALGYVLKQQYDYQSIVADEPSPATFRTAFAAFQRSVALDSTNAEAWHQYAATANYVDDSIARTANRRALALDPARPITLFQLAWLEFVSHHSAVAESLTDSVLTLQPDAGYGRLMLARLRLARGDTAGALAETPKGRFVWFIAALTGDSAGVARECETQSPAYWQAALCYALGGRGEELLIRIAAARPSAVLYWSLRQPELDPLRADPRFQHAFVAAQEAAEASR